MNENISKARLYLELEQQRLHAKLYNLTHTESQLDDSEFLKNTGICTNLEHHLLAIKSALYKIETGTYGICESCKREINYERLQTLPESTLCVACKLNVKKNNRLNPRLLQPISISNRYQDCEVYDDQYS